ncbi:hypothetical protein ACK12G_09395 [Mycolicibacterium wolinskyi]|uniref:hypothetical protein n=1 Tax=Mycolicibacterium wolinskyi TaxID=59750 RepID=UPI0039177BCF
MTKYETLNEAMDAKDDLAEAEIRLQVACRDVRGDAPAAGEPEPSSGAGEG